MKEYEIWMEGYLCSGMEGSPEKASLVTTVKAESFTDACIKYYAKEDPASNYFDKEKLSYWACRLYDNEQEARVAFG